MAAGLDMGGLLEEKHAKVEHYPALRPNESVYVGGLGGKTSNLIIHGDFQSVMALQILSGGEHPITAE